MSTLASTSGGEDKKSRGARKRQNGDSTGKQPYYVKKNKTYKYEQESDAVDVIQAKSSKNYRDRKNEERKALALERDNLKNRLAEAELQLSAEMEKTREYETLLTFYKQENFRNRSISYNTPTIGSQLLALGHSFSESIMDTNNSNYFIDGEQKNVNIFKIENPENNGPLYFQLCMDSVETPEASLDEVDASDLVPLDSRIMDDMSYNRQYSS